MKTPETIAGPVLVATTIEPGGDEAVREGAAIAAGAGARLVVCHVLPEVFGIRPLFPHLREEDRRQADAVRSVATAALQEQVRRVLGDHSPAPELLIEAGSPHAVVLQVAEAQGAGLLVVGAGSRRDPTVLGGVAERVVRHAHCPVLVARGAQGVTVLAATDFSDAALPAVEAGSREARRRALSLVTVHVVEPFTFTFNYPDAIHSPLLPLVMDARTEEGKARLAGIAERYGGTTRLEQGPAAESILRAAEDPPAQLIVVGTHGRTGLKRLALGSVAETVVRKARCSVLVVRLAA